MVCISQSFSTTGSMSLNSSRHGNFDRPCSTAALIPDTSHPFKHTFLPSSDVISWYISISHFACSSFMLDSFSGTSMASSSYPLPWLESSSFHTSQHIFFSKVSLQNHFVLPERQGVGKGRWNSLERTATKCCCSTRLSKLDW